MGIQAPHIVIGLPLTAIRIFICLLLLALNLPACSTARKGNLKLVQTAQEMAQLGCKCTHIQCLWDVRVGGKGYSEIRFKSGAQDLKPSERTQFNKALSRWAKCESTLTEIK